MPGSKPGEIVLYTEVTTSCTHHCDFCPIGHSERRGTIHPDVRRGVLKLISSDLSRRFIVYPHLIGEPLCYPELDGYVRELAALPNVELWLCTNGVLLDEARLQCLLDSGLKNIWFSMFYATPDDYRKHTHSNRFEDVRRNLDHLLARSQAFEKIHIVLFSTGTAELEERIQDKPNVTIQVGRDVHPWKSEGRLYRHRIFRLLFSTMGKFRTKYICVSINGEVGLDWRDYNFRNCIGNIRNLDPAIIIRRTDAGVIDILKRRIYG